MEQSFATLIAGVGIFTFATLVNVTNIGPEEEIHHAPTTLATPAVTEHALFQPLATEDRRPKQSKTME